MAFGTPNGSNQMTCRPLYPTRMVSGYGPVHTTWCREAAGQVPAKTSDYNSENCLCKWKYK
jgi:hypothetical protein